MSPVRSSPPKMSVAVPGPVSHAGEHSISSTIYVLNEHARGALSISGHAEINVGTIIVNSDSATAIRASGHASINADSLNVVGGLRVTNNATVNPAPTPLAAPVADPLAGMPAPIENGPNHGSFICWGNQSHILSPGTYSRIWAAGNCDVTMMPGEYIVRGGGVLFVGHASLTGSEVTIYNTSNQYGWHGSIFLAGEGTVELTPPVSGERAGVVIFQDRDNRMPVTLACRSSLTGIQGTVYAPAADLSVYGQSQIQATLIVDELQLTGGASASLVTDNMNGSELDFIVDGQLVRGELTVSLVDAVGQLTTDERARFADALQTINTAFADYGVTFVEAESTEIEYANVQIVIDSTSSCGGLSDGVLGCTDTATRVTLIDGWNWYTGADPTQIGADQYDFLTVLTHELGHVLGLGHSLAGDSVMNSVLGDGDARRTLTASDMDLIAQHEDSEPLMAEGFAPIHDHGQHVGESHDPHYLADVGPSSEGSGDAAHVRHDGPCGCPACCAERALATVSDPMTTAFDREMKAGVAGSDREPQWLLRSEVHAGVAPDTSWFAPRRGPQALDRSRMAAAGLFLDAQWPVNPPQRAPWTRIELTAAIDAIFSHEDEPTGDVEWPVQFAVIEQLYRSCF